MNRRAGVYYRNRFAGVLSEEPEGGYRFVYDAAYLVDGPAISLTLPLREAAYESKVMFPFFAGLVPEGWYLRIVAPTIKVDEQDTFGLLLHTCGDCIGAVSIRPMTDEQEAGDGG